jgi:gliding motility-associated-like protein
VELLKRYILRIDLILFLMLVNASNIAIAQVISTTGSPSAVSATYGTPSLSTSFLVSGSNMSAGIVIIAPLEFEVSLNDVSYSNTVPITGTGNIPPTRVYIRLRGTLPVGSYNGNIVLRSTGANDVSIVMPLSSVGRAPLPVRIIARITYGEVLNNLTLTFPDFDFSDINAYLKNGEYATSLDVTVSDGNTGTNPVGIYNNAVHSLNLQGSSGFLSSNYNINYQDGEVTIVPAPLVITANSINKPLGNALVSGVSTTGFNVTGLQNNETINSVTITYGNGSAANAPAGTYNGSVVASAASGGNGYLPTNYDVTYISGNIVVASAPPSITASETLQPLTTVYGAPSLPTSFTISGNNLTGGIIITSPTGFEVSADNIIFGNAVTIGSAGTVTPVPVYIRLKQATVVGNYSGTINIQSAGATDVTLTMPASSVTPASLTVTADTKSKLYGDPNPPLTLTYTGFVNGEDATQLTTQPIAATTAMQGSDVGQYPITVSGGSSSNYTLNYIDGTLTVYKDISIPNAFTPNGDGINDTWSIGNLNPNLKITVEIMSRYGARVYYSIGNSVSWDGYSNGVQVPFGVYYYVIKGVKEKPLTGYITVVR